MTDACQNTTHASDRPMEPAKLQNCQECPFRKTNLHRDHPNGIQYTPGEFSKLWRNVSQDGGMFGCHMWDADLHPFDESAKEAGFHAPVDVGARIECAGMVAMVERELDIADAAPSYEEYHRQRPLGMSQKAILIYSARRIGERGPALRFSEHINKDDILDPHDVVDSSSLKWQFSEEQAGKLLRTLEARMPAARKCDCIICERHGEVHPSRTLTTAEDLTVEIDAELHTLLSAMAAAGIRTTDSCINLHECIMAIEPRGYAPLINGSQRGTMNYERVLRRKAAFIRLRNDGSQEQAFISRAEKLPGIETTATGLLTQVVFPQDSIPALLDAVKA